MIEVTHFTDPGCPWAYSAGPALTTLRWRYGDGLRWTLVTIGLTEDRRQYADRGYSPIRAAIGWRTTFERFGMPFAFTPKAGLSATAPACRAIVAVRLDVPGAVRYTAPSLVFQTGGRRLEAGGFQPVEAYDVVVANLDTVLARREPPADPVEVLAAFAHPLASAEVAAVMTPHLGAADLLGVETALIEAVGAGRAVRTAAGNSSLWSLA